MLKGVLPLFCLAVVLPAILATGPIDYGYGPGPYGDQYSHGHAYVSPVYHYVDNSHGHGRHNHDNHGVKSHSAAHGGTSHGSDYYKGHENQHKGYGGKNSDIHHHNSAHEADKNYHDHQNINDGFHNVYHKEEYAKNNKYFDKNGSLLHKNVRNNYANNYDDVNGRIYDDYNKGGGLTSGHQDYDKHYNHGHYQNSGEDYGKNAYGNDHHGYGHGHGHHHGYYGKKK